MADEPLKNPPPPRRPPFALRTHTAIVAADVEVVDDRGVVVEKHPFEVDLSREDVPPEIRDLTIAFIRGLSQAQDIIDIRSTPGPVLDAGIHKEEVV